MCCDGYNREARLSSRPFALLSEGYHGYAAACSCRSRALLGLATLSQVRIERYRGAEEVRKEKQKE